MVVGLFSDFYNPTSRTKGSLASLSLQPFPGDVMFLLRTPPPHSICSMGAS